MIRIERESFDQLVATAELPALLALGEQHPEIFASWQTVETLARIAEHQTRLSAQR